MVEWLSTYEGNPQWARLVAARQLRKRQQDRGADYDPPREQIVPVFVNANQKQDIIEEPLIQESNTVVEDPYNILDGDIQAREVKPSLTKVVMRQREAERNQKQKPIEDTDDAFTQE
jgi:hypothetical protein